MATASQLGLHCNIVLGDRHGITSAGAGSSCDRQVRLAGVTCRGTQAVRKKAQHGQLTILARVYHAPMEQDHEAVKQVEAEGRGIMDGGTDGDACLRQILHHGNHLRRGAARTQPAMGMLHIDVYTQHYKDRL